MQDQKTQVVEQLQEHQKNKNDGDKSNDGIMSRVKELEAENAKLKESSAGSADQSASPEALAEIEQKYTTQIKDLERKLREVQAENSEIKASQLMNTF